MTNGTKHQIDEFTALLASIREYRLAHDFTYRELACLIGIGHSRLFTLLNDRHPVPNERTKYRVEAFAQRVGIAERAAS